MDLDIVVLESDPKRTAELTPEVIRDTMLAGYRGGLGVPLPVFFSGDGKDFTVVTVPPALSPVVQALSNHQVVCRSGHGALYTKILTLPWNQTWTSIVGRLPVDHVGWVLVWALNWMVIDRDGFMEFLTSNPKYRHSYLVAEVEAKVRDLWTAPST